MDFYIYIYICEICANTSSLNKKDGGNVATQEVEAYPVCHFYLAKPCQQAMSIVRDGERELFEEDGALVSYSRVTVKVIQDPHINYPACTQEVVAVIFLEI